MGGAFCFCTGGVFQHCVVFDTVFGQLLTDATVGWGGCSGIVCSAAWSHSMPSEYLIPFLDLYVFLSIFSSGDVYRGSIV